MMSHNLFPPKGTGNQAPNEVVAFHANGNDILTGGAFLTALRPIFLTELVARAACCEFAFGRVELFGAF